MQLDFLSRLIAPLLAPLRVEASPSAPPPESAPPLPAAPGGLSFLPTAELTAKALQALKSAQAVPLLPKLVIRWNPRMRSTAGMAFPGKSLITLNPRLRAFGEGEVERTLLHELAHLLAHARAGRRRIAPHGAEWQRACRDLGLVNEPRCHDLPLPRRRQARPYIYHCPVCRTELHRTRPLRRRVACLPCCRQHNGGKYDERFRFVSLQPRRAAG